jgi:aryl-alcohol dehydrogenase-like predicted oxidoreductase
MVDRRPLGRLKKPVSILGLGLGSVYRNATGTPEKAAELLEHALSKGINFWDTSRGYQTSEELTGPVVAKRRDEIFLVTKSGSRDYDGFMSDFETSLKMLQTDYIDLMHIWNLKPEDDVNEIEKGAFKAVLKLRDEKVIGGFGVTGHSGIDILQQAILRFDPDALLTVFPCTRPDDGAYEDVLLPLARERNMGVIAMKMVRRARNADLVGTDLIRYALSLEGVHCGIVGADTIGHIDDNSKMATNFQPLSSAEQLAMHHTVVERLAGTVEPWKMPGYDDGVWA